MSRRKEPTRTSWTCYVVIWWPNERPDYLVVVSPGYGTFKECKEAGIGIAADARRDGRAAKYACQHVESSSGPNAKERNGALRAMLDVHRPHADKNHLDAEFTGGGIIA